PHQVLATIRIWPKQAVAVRPFYGGGSARAEGLHRSVTWGVRAVRARGAVLAALELLPDFVRVVDANDDEISRLTDVQRVTRGLHLIEERLDLLAASAIRHRLPNPFDDQLSDRAALAAPRIAVFAHHDGVDVARRGAAQLADVVIAPVAGCCHHPDTTSGHQRLCTPRRRLGKALHELAQRQHRRGVVRVVDEHPEAV